MMTHSTMARAPDEPPRRPVGSAGGGRSGGPTSEGPTSERPTSGGAAIREGRTEEASSSPAGSQGAWCSGHRSGTGRWGGPGRVAGCRIGHEDLTLQKRVAASVPGQDSCRRRPAGKCRRLDHGAMTVHDPQQQAFRRARSMTGSVTAARRRAVRPPQVGVLLGDPVHRRGQVEHGLPPPSAWKVRRSGRCAGGTKVSSPMSARLMRSTRKSRSPPAARQKPFRYHFPRALNTCHGSTRRVPLLSRPQE